MRTILASNLESVEASFDRLPSWQESMRKAIRSSQQLLEFLNISTVSTVSTVANPGPVMTGEVDFPVFVPLEFAARMRPQAPDDPLLRQVLASQDERSLLSDSGLGEADPVGDLQAKRTEGLLQKYEGRALLITSGACAVHCRYCFRRHFPYTLAGKGPSGWRQSLELLQEDKSIEELILSGGDPLTVVDDQLEWLVGEVNAIDHLQRLRIHSRVPVVIPQRVCDSMLRWIKASRAAVTMVLHFNHVQEIDSQVEIALRRLRSAGVTLLNQSVLLRGVNDTPESQYELCRRLVNLQVLPYYLHQLDRVSGALHFEVAEPVGKEIISYLRARLPGYAVPKYVREVAGEVSKSPIA